MPIICLLGLLLLLLLLVLETLSILVIGSWIPHARSTGARRALRWSAHLEAVLLSLCWSAHLGAVHLVCLLGLLVLLLLLPLLTHSLCQNYLCYFMPEAYHGGGDNSK